MELKNTSVIKEQGNWSVVIPRKWDTVNVFYGVPNIIWHSKCNRKTEFDSENGFGEGTYNELCADISDYETTKVLRCFNCRILAPKWAKELANTMTSFLLILGHNIDEMNI